MDLKINHVPAFQGIYFLLPVPQKELETHLFRFRDNGHQGSRPFEPGQLVPTVANGQRIRSNDNRHIRALPRPVTVLVPVAAVGRTDAVSAGNMADMPHTAMRALIRMHLPLMAFLFEHLVQRDLRPDPVTVARFPFA